MKNFIYFLIIFSTIFCLNVANIFISYAQVILCPNDVGSQAKCLCDTCSNNQRMPCRCTHTDRPNNWNSYGTCDGAFCIIGDTIANPSTDSSTDSSLSPADPQN